MIRFETIETGRPPAATTPVTEATFSRSPVTTAGLRSEAVRRRWERGQDGVHPDSEEAADE